MSSAWVGEGSLNVHRSLSTVSTCKEELTWARLKAPGDPVGSQSTRAGLAWIGSSFVGNGTIWRLLKAGPQSPHEVMLCILFLGLPGQTPGSLAGETGWTQLPFPDSG